MVARSRARYLAPLALIATVAATAVVVSEVTDSSRAGNRSAPARRLGHTRSLRPVATRTAAFYAVQAGDNLTEIAAKTGVPLATLEALNPGINPKALQTGQRLRLRR